MKEKKPDVTVLVVPRPSNNQMCGVAMGGKMMQADKHDESWVVLTSDKKCLADSTLAHEIGHLFGCYHDIKNDRTDAKWHGYVSQKPTNNWVTIMAYPTNKQVAINQFSNPDVTYGGEPTGNKDAQCANKIAKHIDVISKFHNDWRG